MKPIKTFGLAIVAAIAAMAFVGASSALAAESTALCSKNESPCKSIYGAETEIKGQLKKQTANLEENLKNVNPSVLLGPAGVEEVRCWESSASGKTTTGLVKEGAVTGNLEALSFGHCFYKTNVACTVTVNKLGTLSLQKTGANIGEVKVNGVEVTVVCGIEPIVFECVYKTEQLPMSAKGTGSLGEPAELVASKAKLTLVKFGVGCPSEGFFDGEYEITKPTPIFITT